MARFKTGLCWFFAVFFFFAAIMHFVKVDSFVAMVPPMLPFPRLIVWATGIMELVFAVGLILPKYRKLSGFWLAPYLLAVLPANIYMAMYNIPLGDRAMIPVVLWVRVALQFPLIAVILWTSNNLSFRHKTS